MSWIRLYANIADYWPAKDLERYLDHLLYPYLTAAADSFPVANFAGQLPIPRFIIPYIIVRRLEYKLCKNLTNSSHPISSPFFSKSVPQTLPTLRFESQFFIPTQIHMPRMSAHIILPRRDTKRINCNSLLLFNFNTMSTHFELYILPNTLCPKELLQIIPQSTKPRFYSILFCSILFWSIKTTHPSHSWIGRNQLFTHVPSVPSTSSVVSIVAAVQVVQSVQPIQVAVRVQSSF